MDKENPEGDKPRNGCNCVLGMVAIGTVLALMVAIAALAFTVVLSQTEMKSLKQEVDNLRQKLNQTEIDQASESERLQLMLDINTGTIEQVNNQLSTLQGNTEALDDSLQNEIGELRNLITVFNQVYTSCSDVPEGSLSGQYWIQTNSDTDPILLYCDMARSCCDSVTGGWTRVANLDMTDPNQQCPDGLRLVNRTTAPLRTCGKGGLSECSSTTFPVHGIEYSRVCGRIIGYQFGFPDAFTLYVLHNDRTIDDLYVEGCSLTHGQSPRQHIWTFTATGTQLQLEDTCQCAAASGNFTEFIPPFIGQDYFCDSGSNNPIGVFDIRFYDEDPLWDGQGCVTSSCCTRNSPPWFCKELPETTTDDIELRLCGNQGVADEDTPLEIVELYIK